MTLGADPKLLDVLSRASSLELFQLQVIIDRMLADPSSDELGPLPSQARCTTADCSPRQRVSVTDRDLQHRIGLIVRISQQTATLDCDGQTWRVASGLPRHVVDA